MTEGTTTTPDLDLTPGSPRIGALEWVQCDPSCDGWGVFECDGAEDPRIEIERCDECARFRDDDEAREHVARVVGRLVESDLLRVTSGAVVELVTEVRDDDGPDPDLSGDPFDGQSRPPRQPREAQP